MSIFHNHEVVRHSWNLNCTSTNIYENFTEGVNSLVSEMKTQYKHQSLKQNNILWFCFFSHYPIFSALMGFFLEMVGLFAYLPNLFFVVCFMMQLDAKNIVCCSQLVLLEMFICWGNMPTDHDNC